MQVPTDHSESTEEGYGYTGFRNMTSFLLNVFRTVFLH
jgi:hypothetical protein